MRIDEPLALDEHAARPTARVVDPVRVLWGQHGDEQAHDAPRRRGQSGSRCRSTRRAAACRVGAFRSPAAARDEAFRSPSRSPPWTCRRSCRSRHCGPASGSPATSRRSAPRTRCPPCTRRGPRDRPRRPFCRRTFSSIVVCPSGAPAKCPHQVCPNPQRADTAQPMVPGAGLAQKLDQPILAVQHAERRRPTVPYLTGSALSPLPLCHQGTCFCTRRRCGRRRRLVDHELLALHRVAATRA